ncbi:hypothetical protein BpHYR1_015581 [Brachionus plicatilis]|uniref:Uncharacterized protein n=1 Tax=Brachionus plicatilis TaxID=10195 RepID=A0A3M7PZS8_BRAPC|nr:hypothetical protein BpHYR1_015581 [Brachionus plicatilis]
MRSLSKSIQSPIYQLEKMINHINTSDLNCTLESLGHSVDDANDQMQSKLEDEIKRRLFLERKISELNSEKIELAQKLSVSEEKAAKKGLLLKNFQSTLTKAVEKWKNKEKEFIDYVDKVKSEKQDATIEVTRLTMRNQLIEQEMKKISDELIGEKVRSQEHINQHLALKSSLNDTEAKLEERNGEIKNLLEKISHMELEKVSLNTEIDQINENLHQKQEEADAYKNKINFLNEKNQSLLDQYDSLKVEYENLINEAKSVIEESERQYTHLSRTIESEKLKKDTLQVEINMMEEKFEHKIKSLIDDYENKLSLANDKAVEKEKNLVENHKSEMDQLKSKFQYDLDKTKYKLNEEFKEKINEYESKILNLNQNMDSYSENTINTFLTTSRIWNLGITKYLGRKFDIRYIEIMARIVELVDTLHIDIKRLEAANYDLENERNTIRRNLKQQLEMQMKETFEILGLENENSSKFRQIKSNSLNSSLQHRASSPLLEFLESTNTTKDEPKPAIKDAFIINQIDLINKYYQIDNTAIQVAGVVAASNPSLCEEVDVTCTSSPKKLDAKQEKNTSMNNSRSSELRYYIDILLNKPPSTMGDEKEEQKNNGYNDLSDIEMGYTKKQPCDYYDDVKRNLNFDLSDTDQDDSYDDTENSSNKYDCLNLKNLAL